MDTKCYDLNVQKCPYHLSFMVGDFALKVANLNTVHKSQIMFFVTVKV